MLRFIVIAGIALFSVAFLLQCCFRFRTSDSEAINDFNTKGLLLRTPSIKIGNKHIHYAQIGNDSLPTLLFVHGSPGSWDNFMTYMQDQDLLAKYRMVSVDRPGFGYSDFGQSLHLQQQSDLISQLIGHLSNGKPLYLIGHSLGGPLVALLAADNPKSINGILVLAGALDPALEPKEKWRPIAAAFPLRYLIPGAFRPSNQELWYLKQDLYPLKDKLDQIVCDVYIMHGEKDVLVDVKNVDFMKVQFTQAKSLKDTIWQAENHFIPWKRFKEIKQVLLIWPK